jgi:hypothetical protein
LGQNQIRIIYACVLAYDRSEDHLVAQKSHSLRISAVIVPAQPETNLKGIRGALWLLSTRQGAGHSLRSITKLGLIHTVGFGLGSGVVPALVVHSSFTLCGSSESGAHMSYPLFTSARSQVVNGKGTSKRKASRR